MGLMLLPLIVFTCIMTKRAADALDPSFYLQWEVSYITVAPLGVQQQVIAINGQFPGPIIKSTTNDNLVINVLNHLDEDLLLTWNGIQQRRTSWQDGVTGTNCGIPPKWNWTYNFQVKDQIGSYFYFPSLGLQRAGGGYGGFTITNRAVISVPFGLPDGDITILIGDWYNAGHKVVRGSVERGQSAGTPDGVVINGKGPYPYDSSVPRGILWQTFDVEPGKTYRIRVSNVGTSTSLNFRIQNHNLLLVETEGSYVAQQSFSSLDIHVGQSCSFLVTMDQDASSDYYVVASARFVDMTKWSHPNGVAILHYSNSRGPAAGFLPPLPDDSQDPFWSLTQAQSIKWNLTAGAARPNPQGSFHYGQIAVTQTLVLRGSGPMSIQGGGTLRYGLNGISYATPSTPLKLADYYGVSGVYTLDAFPRSPGSTTSMSLTYLTSVTSGVYRGFMEIIFQNDDGVVQSYHLDGYAFFVVGFGSGEWTEANRGSYNMIDAVARSTSQVFPKSWTAILVELDNVGMWNLRSQLLPNWYLGQEMYIRVYNPDNSIQTEEAVPDNAIYCGLLASRQKMAYTAGGTSGATTSHSDCFYTHLQLLLLELLFLLLTMFCTTKY